MAWDYSIIQQLPSLLGWGCMVFNWHQGLSAPVNFASHSCDASPPEAWVFIFLLSSAQTMHLEAAISVCKSRSATQLRAKSWQKSASLSWILSPSSCYFCYRIIRLKKNISWTWIFPCRHGCSLCKCVRVIFSLGKTLDFITILVYKYLPIMEFLWRVYWNSKSIFLM